MLSTPRKLLLWLGAFAGGLIIALFLLRQPTVALTREALESARQRWHAANMSDYDLAYRMHGSRYDVKVRGGLVVEANVDGGPFVSGAVQLTSMDGLFSVLAMELENAADAHPPPAMRVGFDPGDGHLVRYLRGKSGLGRSTSIEVTSFRKIPP